MNNNFKIIDKHVSCAATLEQNKQEGSIINKVCNIISSKFSASSTVKVLRLNGVIGVGKMNLNFAGINEYIEKAFKKRNTAAVCLIINSPGGSPVQSELIASRIISLAKEKGIEVYSFVEDVAASGGYWLACAGNKIYASKNSIIGSVGVISKGFGATEAIEKLGIERRIFAAGNNKSLLDPFQKAKESDIKILKKILENIHSNFIDYVKSRRKGCLNQVDDILFNGDIWTGESAVDFGLIDGISDMYSFIRENFGEKVKIEYIKPKTSWIKEKIGIVNNFSLNKEDVSESISDTLKDAVIKNKFTLE